MPVELLSDRDVASYAVFWGEPSRSELEQAFCLDDDDRKLIFQRRSDRNRLGVALQLTTVRFLGRFLPDPLNIPRGVVEYLADQLLVEDVGCLPQYGARRAARSRHVELITANQSLRDFEEFEASLREWVHARAWTTGDGPKAILIDGVRWVRQRNVLLPGVTTLARLVAQERQNAYRQLWLALDQMLTEGQRKVLDGLAVVEPGERVSVLESWRKGTSKPSGRQLEKAIDRVTDISGAGFGAMDLEQEVPGRRLTELARYGMTATSTQIRRHPPARRMATLLATVVHLESVAVDDALELFDLSMVTELVGKAERETDKQQARSRKHLARASAKLALAVEVMFVANDWGNEVSVDQVWEGIEAVISRQELMNAVVLVNDLVPAPDADEHGEMRAELSTRIATVRGFVKILTKSITFGATTEGEQVLAAMQSLPELLGVSQPKRLRRTHIDAELVRDSWGPLVFPAEGEIEVDRDSYVFCILTQFHNKLKRREVYAQASSRWQGPRAQLLDGAAWETAKGPALKSLELSESPDESLDHLSQLLDDTYRSVADRIETNDESSVGEDGRLHVERIKAITEPKSLIELRKRVNSLMPRVDLPEVLLEVLRWEPDFAAAFVPASGGRSRLDDLPVTITACLTAHSLNIGYGPVAKKGVPALERDRIGHVSLNYLRPETYSKANAPLIARQATIPLAKAWGGGLVASVDGMRFVVPVPSIYARPNRKFFGPKRGITWLNMINDQASGLGAKVVSGTPRDSLHMIDVLYARDGGQRPDIVVTDTGSYSDLIFGMVPYSVCNTGPSWPICRTRNCGGSIHRPATAR